jgi:hypothetical protein
MTEKRRSRQARWRYYAFVMLRRFRSFLLPEEDALDELDEDDEPVLTLPGDLWFRVKVPNISRRILPNGPVLTRRRGIP